MIVDLRHEVVRSHIPVVAGKTGVIHGNCVGSDPEFGPGNNRVLVDVHEVSLFVASHERLGSDSEVSTKLFNVALINFSGISVSDNPLGPGDLAISVSIKNVGKSSLVEIRVKTLR